MLNLLEGMRVVEVSSFMMGPICGRVLADWGAEVVKIEPATAKDNGGDRIRGMCVARNIVNGDPCCYEYINGNKKSVAIDTTKPEGVKMMQKLCASADVVISHLRKTDSHNLGIDYDTLVKANPGIIVATTSGYGIKGPDAVRPGFDAVAYAARTGQVIDITQDGSPIIPFMGYGDTVAGTYMAASVLAAYVKKLRTGKGEDVYVSLYGCGIWSAGIPVMAAQYGDPYPTGRDDVFPTTKPFKCSDGQYVYLMGQIWETVLPGLIKIMDMPEDSKKRWPSYLAAKPQGKEITEILDEQFAKHPRSYWLEKLSKTKIPFDVCAHYSDVQKDEQAWANNFLIKPEQTTSVEYNTGVPTAPGQFRFSGEYTLKNSGVGDSTREELKKVGYTDEQIDAFRAKGIVAEEDQWDPDFYNITKPGTFYNRMFSPPAGGSKK